MQPFEHKGIQKTTLDAVVVQNHGIISSKEVQLTNKRSKYEGTTSERRERGQLQSHEVC